MNWTQFLTDLQKLLTDATNCDLTGWTTVMNDLAQLIQDATPTAPPAVAAALNHLRAHLPKGPKPEARDWSGFFSALASFFTTILPLIQPFLVKK
jgi:hypothetical protein